MFNDPHINNYRKRLKLLSSFKDVRLHDKYEHARCGCYIPGGLLDIGIPGCPEGKVCCSCGPCKRENFCGESCGVECEVPAICTQNITNLNDV